MRKWKVGIAYERYGYINVTGETREDAIKAANKKINKMTVKELDAVTEYLQDSEEVDEESIEEIEIKQKIIVLIGRSGCGKSAIAKRLMENHGYKTVRTATTRDRREGEAEDAYYFMSKKEFMDHVNKNEFVEYTVYNENYYGTLKKELQTDAKLVIVLTPEGAQAIKKEFPDTFIVYVETTLQTAVMRAITREDSINPAIIQNIGARACADEILFKNPVCDCILSNQEDMNLEDLVWNLLTAYADWKSKLGLINIVK